MSGGSGSFMIVLSIVIPEAVKRLSGMQTDKTNVHSDDKAVLRAHETELRARRLRMRDLRDAPGEARPAAGLDRRAHALRHRDGIARLRDRSIEQHGRAAELHGERRVGGGADAGIEYDRYRRARADKLDEMRVSDAKPRADRRAQWDHGGG